MCSYSMLIVVLIWTWDIKVGEGHSYNKIKKYVKTSCNKITKNLVGCKKRNSKFILNNKWTKSFHRNN